MVDPLMLAPSNPQKDRGVEKKFTIKTKKFLTESAKSSTILPSKVEKQAEKVTERTGQNHLNPIIRKDRWFESSVTCRAIQTIPM
jgi:hypothetical protein